jgi:hypothetical protein
MATLRCAPLSFRLPLRNLYASRNSAMTNALIQPVQGLQNLHFGGGVSQTVINPGVLAAVLVAGVLMYIWPRQKAVAAFLAAALMVPTDQVLLIGPAHFPMLRILILFGIFRMSREKISSGMAIFSGGIKAIDVGVIALASVVAVNAVILFQATGALIYQLGELYSIFGTYFLLRFFIRSEEDVASVFHTLAWIAAIVATVMTYEATTGHNPYALLGGAAASHYASLVARDDRFRAQGPFAHSILAGTFGAILLPLFVALWWKGKRHHKAAIVGVIAATVITIACNSSTPVLAYIAGVLGLLLWPLRGWMRAIRWSIAAAVVMLQLVLKNPIWHLITKIDISGGSSSWHRFMLIDQCIRHFGDWWLIGVKDTSVWGWDMWDTANTYVATCDNSGLLPFLLFIAILVYGFKFLGRARRIASREKDKNRALFVWALGSALFANVIAFFGISYFDQNMVAWYCLLAMISAVAAVRAKKRSSAKASEENPSSIDWVPHLSEVPADFDNEATGYAWENV